MTEVDREINMEKIWMRALNKKILKKSLVVQKRSTIYTVMQNKFTGKLYKQKAVLDQDGCNWKCIVFCMRSLFLTSSCSKRFV